jgi:hypothetical protein
MISEGFRTELERRIRRRRALLAPSATAEGASGPLRVTIDQEWLARNREAAHAGMERVGLPGFWESVVAIQPRGEWAQQQLRQAVDASTICTFGWPIGVSSEQEGERTRPTAGGIVTEIAVKSGSHGPHYDYWNLQRSGDFYLLRSLFEDSRGKTEELFFNTRIVQVTEMLLFLARLYGQQLQLSGTTIVLVGMTHGGLAGRRFSYVGNPRYMRPNRVCSEPAIETALMTTVDELESRLVENVKELLSPVVTLFDFMEIPDSTWADIVERFVAGEVT